MAHSLLTTVIGSFPKPEYLPIEDWFDAARNEGAMNSERVTENFTKYQENTKESDEQLFIKAAEEVINLQINSGIDKNTSTIRIKISSTFPPIMPAILPIVTPTTTVKHTTISDNLREVLAPQTTP